MGGGQVPLESLTGVPGGGRSPDIPGRAAWGDLGHTTFSTWKGNGKKSTMGHLSPYDSDMGSEDPLIQSVSKHLLSTYCVPGIVLSAVIRC